MCFSVIKIIRQLIEKECFAFGKVSLIKFFISPYIAISLESMILHTFYHNTITSNLYYFYIVIIIISNFHIIIKENYLKVF